MAVNARGTIKKSARMMKTSFAVHDILP